MDRLDVRILNALQQEGDLTQAQLAERVGSSPSTCLRRVQRLKDSGHLQRCVYLADPGKLERGLRAIITVVTTGHGRELREAFAEKIRHEAAIGLAYGVTGEVDAVLCGNFADMEEYQAVCDRLFDHDPHVVRYTTFFAVERYKEETAIPSDALAAKLGEK
jgi:Lrp/AsnC family transcriptional regulator, leucine-responsive regulatory protein